MGKNYNYYDTPSNHPEAVKYRGWETAILIFGIGVVSTLLILYHFFGQPSANPQDTANIQAVAVTQVSNNKAPQCEQVNLIHAQKRDRLIQLLALSNDLPIEQVLVNEIGTVCYDKYNTPDYDVMTDIIVTVGYTPAAKLNDYEELGNLVAVLLPPMLQIESEQPRDLVIRFLVGDTYLEWSRSYHQTALYTRYASGESLWFWAEPEY